MASNKRFSLEEEAILKTLLYSDIFDFPLTKDELWKFLIVTQRISHRSFQTGLKKLKGVIIAENGYYCLSGREEIIRQRKKSQLILQKKLQLAQQTAFILSYIPTIRFIGLSGSLALGDAAEDDDIDFFIVTKKGTLFITRLWILALLEWKNLRRKRGKSIAADKICVNLLIDESQLTWYKREQDLYLAHEIVQMKPLFERANTYEQLLESNKWVRKFLPNGLENKNKLATGPWKTDYQSMYWVSRILIPFEQLIRHLQVLYMKKHMTGEFVSKVVLALHPNDYRSKILALFRTKCEKLGLLTNV